MAHYAFLSDDCTVTEVIVGRDEHDGSGIDWETYYSAVRGMRCLRTSYRTAAGQHPEGKPFRLNYASPGWVYRDDLDGFIPPCPGEAWTLDESTGMWSPPSA